MTTKRMLMLGGSGLVAIALLAVAAWMLLGGNGDDAAQGAVQIIPPANAPAVANPGTAAAPSPAPPPATTPEPTAAELAVYITGAVVNPGVYTVTAGQRLDAVLARAGGPTDDADLSRINLAAYVADADHYRIPVVGEATTTAPPSADPVSSPAAGEAAPAPAVCATPVDINSAAADCLQTLPGIGQVRAKAIVAYREQAGPFAAPGDITAVSGIGDGIYRQIADLITVKPR